MRRCRGVGLAVIAAGARLHDTQCDSSIASQRREGNDVTKADVMDGKSAIGCAEAPDGDDAMGNLA